MNGRASYVRFTSDSGHFARTFVNVDPHQTMLAAASVLLRRKQSATVGALSFCFMLAAASNFAIG